MTIVKLAVADDDVLRRLAGKLALTAFATIVVASALDGDAVVTRIEIAILNQYSVARLWVAAVTVRTVVVDMDATNGNIRRKQRVKYPEGRTQQGHILDKNTFTLVEVNHLGAQTILGTKAALVHVDTVLCIFQQTGTGSLILCNAAGLHAETCIATPRPPSLVRATAVNGSLTRDGDILGLIGIDQRAEVPAVQTFPACRYDGVELWFKGKLQDSTFLHDEVDAALQLDGCCQELLSGRYDNATAALLGALVNSLLNGYLVLGSRIGSLGAILGDEELFVSKLRNADALLNLLVLLLIPLLSLSGHGYENTQQ